MVNGVDMRGSTHYTGLIGHGPRQLLTIEDGTTDDQRDKLDLGTSRLDLVVCDRAVLVVWELLVHGQHLGFRDKMQCLLHSEGGDCLTVSKR